MSDRLHVALIDDDAGVLDALGYYLARQSIRTSTFQAAKEFLEALDRREQFDCIVSDVRMPGMTGLDLVKQLNERGYPGPVILITGHGDVDMAVGAIKNGAFDFIEKPFNAETLVTRVRDAIAATARVKAPTSSGLAARFPGRDLLTPREYQVLELIANGASNKEAGRQLGISPRTIEVHRSRIMEKLGAKNTVDLVHIVLSDRD